MGKYNKRFGDRYDGRLLRTIDPFMKIVPFIMKSRMDAQNYFEDKFDIGRVEKYLREKNDEGIKNIGILHIFLAALIRTISQNPGLNRFINGQRVYARNDISIAFVVKKQLSKDSPETTVKLSFKPTDTLSDVVKIVNDAIEYNRKEESENGTDKIIKLIMMLPRFLINLVVWFIITLDYYGLMPKSIYEVSPFHSSIFITDIGSIGLPALYHHLYGLGTTSVFVSFGTKQKERLIGKNDIIAERKYVNVRATIDERIMDGYNFASSFKLFKRLVENPRRLELPPENVIEDQE